MNYGKLIQGFFALLFTAITLWAVVHFVEMHRTLKARQAELAANQRQLAEAQARLQKQERYLERLRRDPVLVEQLIRQKLGYAKGEEFVFRFDEEKK